MTESESTPTPSEPEPEKSPGNLPENAGTSESAKLLEQRARELQTHIQGFGDEVRALATNMENRKRETTVLKIMLYTGVVVMMVAFFYSSNALHEAQLKSFEANLNHMQGMMQANLQAVERNFHREIRNLEEQITDLEGRQSSYYLKEQKLSEVVRTLNEAIEPLAKNNPQLAAKLDELNRNSEAFAHSFKDETGETPGLVHPPLDPDIVFP